MDFYRAVRSAEGIVRVLVACAFICLFALAPLAHAQSAAQGPNNTRDKSQQTGSEQSVSLNKLADLLENDKSREKLIAELREAAAKDQKPSGPRAEAKNSAPAQALIPAGGQAGPQLSFARRFAKSTAAWSETIGHATTKAWHHVVVLAHSKTSGRPGSRLDWSGFLQSVLMFAIVAAATVVAFLMLRLLAATLYSRITRLPDSATTHRGLVFRRITAMSIGILVDAAVVCLAGGVGYAVGLYGIGDHGAMGTRQSLFINAFVLIELIKVVIRALFSDRYDNLRPLRIAPEIAAWWSIRLRWFIGVIGYVLLVIVPILNEQLTLFAGAMVTFFVMGAAYVYALIVIFRNRRLLTARLRGLADKTSLGFFSVLYRLLARIWVFLAVAYFTTLFVVGQLYPEQALPSMLWASLQTLIAAVVCFSVSGLLSRTIGARFRFSDRLRDRLPKLEERLNSYVPNALKIVRLVILILFVAITLNIWNIFDFSAWLGTDIGIRIVGAAIHVALILAAAAAVWVVAASVIEHRMSPNTGRGAPSARQQTLLTLFRNALAIVIAGFTALICLSQIGVNIGPLIAGAGVFGLAIGFGAQKLVQDIITGVFIQLENAMNTGDVVSVSGITGTAERLTIRSVSIRDIDGTYHIVPFSSADVVSNYMRDWAYYRVEYGIAFREDIDNAIYYLREAFEDLKSDPNQGPNILEDMTVPGVTEIADSAINIRIMIKTKPGTQWGVGRAFNRLVKIHFDRAGIEIPFPHQRLWFGEDRHGHAPAAKIRLLEADDDAAEPRYRPKRRRRADDEAPEETGDAPA